MSTTSSTSARVEVLTAEVKALMVGSRQVTMSVFKQLDEVSAHSMEPFGRVNYEERYDGIGVVRVVGRGQDGSLVRSYMDYPRETVRVDALEVIEFLSAHDTSEFARLAVDLAVLALFHVPYARKFDGGPLPFAGDRIYRLSSSLVGLNFSVHQCVEHAQPERGIPWEGDAREFQAALGLAFEDATVRLSEWRAQYAEWSKLPLIVLAGLR